ncbi:unnamed protein product [Bursaphelenchus okinawaensis]|uniref:Uncharacterized protein n=1 Tax=Bursaphelenchus okinawaensis TaxID=465554 RepID=A0A811LK40_9BILA|nr:unnamed protein product [Bursaphelenchus okinawaensis]CAG9123958.1 unnamed protein product [Bursaphelenchus okinawaensis]
MGFVYGQCVASCCMMTGARGVLIKSGNVKKVADAIDKYKFYGTTETLCIAAHDAKDNNPSSSVGKLMPNVEVKINSETNAELGINEIGDIQIKVPSCSPGYINNPEANKDLYTSDGFLDIGDVGYIDAKGFLYLVDRKKEMLKVGGRQASPSELEDILMTHPLVQDCAIVGMPDPLTDQRITGFVVRRDHSLTEEECLTLVNSKVSEFKQITGGIHFMDAIPRNPNGKIMRRKIKENFNEIATK